MEEYWKVIMLKQINDLSPFFLFKNNCKEYK